MMLNHIPLLLAPIFAIISLSILDFIAEQGPICGIPATEIITAIQYGSALLVSCLHLTGHVSTVIMAAAFFTGITACMLRSYPGEAFIAIIVFSVGCLAGHVLYIAFELLAIFILHFFPGAIPESPTSLAATPATATAPATLNSEQGHLACQTQMQALQDELNNLRVDHSSQLASLQNEIPSTAATFASQADLSALEASFENTRQEDADLLSALTTKEQLNRELFSKHIDEVNIKLTGVQGTLNAHRTSHADLHNIAGQLAADMAAIAPAMDAAVDRKLAQFVAKEVRPILHDTLVKMKARGTALEIRLETRLAMLDRRTTHFLAELASLRKHACETFASYKAETRGLKVAQLENGHRISELDNDLAKRIDKLDNDSRSLNAEIAALRRQALSAHALPATLSPASPQAADSLPTATPAPISTPGSTTTPAPASATPSPPLVAPQPIPPIGEPTPVAITKVTGEQTATSVPKPTAQSPLSVDSNPVANTKVTGEQTATSVPKPTSQSPLVDSPSLANTKVSGEQTFTSAPSPAPQSPPKSLSKPSKAAEKKPKKTSKDKKKKTTSSALLSFDTAPAPTTAPKAADASRNGNSNGLFSAETKFSLHPTSSSEPKGPKAPTSVFNFNSPVSQDALKTLFAPTTGPSPGPGPSSSKPFNLFAPKPQGDAPNLAPNGTFGGFKIDSHYKPPVVTAPKPPIYTAPKATPFSFQVPGGTKMPPRNFNIPPPAGHTIPASSIFSSANPAQRPVKPVTSPFDQPAPLVVPRLSAEQHAKLYNLPLETAPKTSGPTIGNPFVAAAQNIAQASQAAGKPTPFSFSGPFGLDNSSGLGASRHAPGATSAAPAASGNAAGKSSTPAPSIFDAMKAKPAGPTMIFGAPPAMTEQEKKQAGPTMFFGTPPAMTPLAPTPPAMAKQEKKATAPAPSIFDSVPKRTVTFFEKPPAVTVESEDEDEEMS